MQLKAVLQSIFRQTRLPDEVLIVVDGPVSFKLEQEVERFLGGSEKQNLQIEINCLKLDNNEGLGEAMRKAVLVAKGDYIARMDADDICLPDRFEKQMKCFEEDAKLSIVGGQISEFDGDVHHITGRRVVPREHGEIAKFMRSRNAMSHMTVIIKKKDLLEAGNYQPFYLLEDHYLWVRMLQHGCMF